LSLRQCNPLSTYPSSIFPDSPDFCDCMNVHIFTHGQPDTHLTSTVLCRINCTWVGFFDPSDFAVGLSGKYVANDIEVECRDRWKGIISPMLNTLVDGTYSFVWMS
jgi:hypothetical protein